MLRVRGHGPQAEDGVYAHDDDQDRACINNPRSPWTCSETGFELDRPRRRWRPHPCGRGHDVGESAYLPGRATRSAWWSSRRHAQAATRRCVHDPIQAADAVTLQRRTRCGCRHRWGSRTASQVGSGHSPSPSQPPQPPMWLVGFVQLPRSSRSLSHTPVPVPPFRLREAVLDRAHAGSPPVAGPVAAPGFAFMNVWCAAWCPSCRRRLER